MTEGVVLGGWEGGLGVSWEGQSTEVKLIHIILILTSSNISQTLNGAPLDCTNDMKHMDSRTFFENSHSIRFLIPRNLA